MFKRLRERIAEEATKFPVGQLANNSGKPIHEAENKGTENNSSEDLITLSDSSSVVVPHTSPQQFSIGEEDGSLSEQSTPQKKQNASSGDSNTHHGANSSGFTDMGFGQEYRPSKKLSYVPQSDIESEREDPPTLNLDGISKDQLMAAIQTLKARSYKYKNKYAEVVKNFKELREEKMKIENTLIENQDKGLRRIAELREQCQLEQKAKAHLEENLRLLLEEKDSRICVLETQINLLKEGGKSDNTKTLPEDCDNQLSDAGSGDTRSEDSSTSMSNDISVLQEKVERLQHQINQDKKTITAQKDQISLLRKQNENLSEELEKKVKRLNSIEDEQMKLKLEHESILKNMQNRLNELEKQQEESIMSMAETKRNMHEELELKEKQLIKAEEESKHYQAIAEREKEIVSELKRQQDEKIKELQHQLELTEKTLEDEKQSLLHELAQGKAAAISLMQQECAKKITAVEEEWKSKYEALESSVKKISQVQVEESTNSLKCSEEKLKQAEEQVEQLSSLVTELEKENASLKNSVEKLESENIEARHEESLKCMKDKLQNAEKNYKTQIEELKLKINQFEKEKSILISEKENLLIVQNQLKDLKSGEEKVQSELKSKEEELKVLKEKLDTSNKEQVEKIHTFQENMKDKENMILKLKTNIESISKEHKESIEEFQKKIKWLEVEREQLMLQAQERVSATEAKCREDIKSLHEKCEKLLQENSEIEKLRNQLNAAELNEVAANKKVALLREELASVEKKLAEFVYSKQISESEWSSKLEKLVEENKILLNNNDHVERLKSEKEELNEKLKSAVQQVNKINILQAERDLFQKEKEELSKELNQQKMLQNVSTNKIKSLEAEKMTMKEKIEELSCENEKLKAEILDLKNSFKSEKDNLLLEKEKLLNQIQQLESCVSDPQNTSVQSYVETLKKEYETAIKAKDDDMLTKLKQLVKDFSIQMDLKDKDSEQTIAELMEKNQYIEEKLQREYSIQIQGLREDLQEKMCALDEMRDSYEEAIQEKDTKIKELELAIKCLSSKDNSGTDSFHGTTEPSDWDDTWVVPDEVAENSSPSHGNKTCDEHMKQIELLQEELSKCNSEIKELKVLLRLSPPDTMVNNNNRRDSLQSLPEPTEFEYLKNIIYEYMMGKEPVTLVKVIAAVLRFNDVQTQQVIRREEARHPTR